MIIYIKIKIKKGVLCQKCEGSEDHYINEYKVCVLKKPIKIEKFKHINNPISFELNFDSIWEKYFFLLYSLDLTTVKLLIITNIIIL